MAPALPALLLRSDPDAPVRCLVGSRPVWDTAEPLPLPPDGELYVEAVPVPRGDRPPFLPRGIFLHLQDGKITLPEGTCGAELTAWPNGLYELTVSPLPLPPGPGDIRVLSRVRHDFGSGDYLITVSLLPQGLHCHITAINDGHTVYSKVFPDCTGDFSLTPATLTRAAGDDVILQARKRDGTAFAAAIAGTFGKFVTLIQGSADRVLLEGEIPNAVYLENGSDTFLRYRTRSGYSAANGETHTVLSSYPRFAKDKKDCMRIFFEALRFGQTEDLRSVCTPELSQALSEKELRGFLGPFTELCEPPFDTLSPDLAALASPFENGMRHIRLFRIGFAAAKDAVSAWKIRDISPILQEEMDKTMAQPI